MQRWTRRPWAALSTGLLLYLLSVFAVQAQRGLPPNAEAAPDAPPVLINAGFECSQGYAVQSGIIERVPSGWTAKLLNGNPRLNSTTMDWRGDHACVQSNYEKIEGERQLGYRLRGYRDAT